jgi:hypothetical protein
MVVVFKWKRRLKGRSRAQQTGMAANSASLVIEIVFNLRVLGVKSAQPVRAS